MERAFRDLSGGILGLIALPRATWVAIEADLFARGFFLGDVPARVNWRLVRSLVHLAVRGSVTFAELYGEAGWWDHSDHLLAAIYDALRAGNWQRSGGQGGYPEPYPRPGADIRDERGKRIDTDSVKYFGADALTPQEFDRWWNGEGEG